MKQLESTGRIENCTELGVHLAGNIERLYGTVAEECKLGAEPLASLQKLRCLIEHGGGIWAERGESYAMLLQRVVNALLKKPCESSRFVHAASLLRREQRRLYIENIVTVGRVVMALSEHEQRLLDEMERGLYQSEADVMQTASGSRRRVNYRSLVLGIILALVGIGVLVGGVAAQQLWLGLIGFAAMLGGVLLMFTPGAADSAEPSARPTGKSGGSHKERTPRESFSERMERRWDERMEGDR